MREIIIAALATCFIVPSSAQTMSKCRMDKIFTPTCKQASCIVDGHLIALRDNGEAYAYRLFQDRDSVIFNLASAQYRPHCNVANVWRKSGRNYMYLSEWNGQRRMFVEDIAYNRRTNTFDTRLVQIFSIDMPDSISGPGFMDWVIDVKGRKLYTIAYNSNARRNDKVECDLTLMEFILPDPKSGDRVFREKDIVRRTILPMTRVTQDKEVHNGKLYILAGIRDKKTEDWSESRQIAVVDLKTLTVERRLYLGFYFDEPEGIDFIGNRMMVTFRRGSYYITEER